jgi:hypothetical protein
VRVAAEDALASAALDAPELLDVDVDQLARPLTLVALRGLDPEPAEAGPIPTRVRIPETVDSGRSKLRARRSPVL